MTLGGDDFKYEEVEETVVTNVMYHGSGGVKWAGLWTILQGRDTSHPAICVINVDPDAPDGPDPRGLPPQGVPLADGMTYLTTS